MSDADVAGYEIWDTQSRNLLYDFDTEVEALEAIRELVVLNGPSTTDALALVRVHTYGRSTTLAMGDTLAARLQSGEPRQGRVSA